MRRFIWIIPVIGLVGAIFGPIWLADSEELDRAKPAYGYSNDPYAKLPRQMADALRHCPGNEAAVVQRLGQWELDYSQLAPCLKLVLKVTIKDTQVNYSHEAYNGLRFTPEKSTTTAIANGVEATYRSYTVTGLAQGDKLFAVIQRNRAGSNGVWSEYRPAQYLGSYPTYQTHELYLLIYDATSSRANSVIGPQPWGTWASVMPRILQMHPVSF